MRTRTKAFLIFSIASLIFSSCNNFLHDLIPTSENDISSFRVKDMDGLDVTESTEIDESDISIMVKAGSDVSKLFPSITASEKSTVIPLTVGYIHAAAPSVNLLNFAVQMQEARTSGDLASWALNFAQKTPDFHVPDLSLPIDFRTTVPVAVIAGDGNTKIYQVTVEHGEVLDENGEPLPDQGQKEIVAFSVEGQEGESEIDESGVTFTMAEGQDIRALIPHVEVSQGATFLPFTQDYLLKYVDFQDFISLLSGYSSASDPERFLASWLRKNNISLSGELDTPIDFSDTVQFIVQAADGSVKLVPVRCVTLISEMPKLLSWVFTKLSNENLVRDSETDFSFTTFAEVEIVFPYDYLKDNEEKDESFRLVPSFTMDADRAEFSMDDGATWQGLVSSETVIPFTAIKKDCKIRVWKGTKSADYTLSVSYTEDPDTIRSITDFRFPKSKNPAIKATALATIVDDGDVGTITVAVVYNAGDEDAVKSLKATWVSPGTVYSGDGYEISSGYSFYNSEFGTRHMNLTCVSRNGMYRRVYSVTIKFVEVQPAVAAMRTFSFPALLNPSLAGDAVGIINDSNQTILVNAVYRTAEKPSRLVAEFTSTGNVDADGIPQSSGYSGSDFRYARNYTVTASDDPGVKKTYRVQVSFRYDSSMACSLDSMVFRAADNPTLSKDVEVSISQSGLKGSAFLPYGTDSWNTALIPTFEAQGKVSVNGVPQTSGVDSWNFSDDVVYTVESADRSVRKDYTIHVTETGSIIYVDCRAQGRGDGSSWEDAFTTMTAAGETLDTLPDGSSFEVWIADTDGRDYYIEDPNDTYDGKRYDYLRLNNDKPGSTIAIRGGFSGTESTPEERDEESMKNRVRQAYVTPELHISADLKSLVLDGLTYIAMNNNHIEDLVVKDMNPGHSSIQGNADNVHIENSDVNFGYDDYYTLRTSNITAENSVVTGLLTVKNGGETVFKECRTFSNPEEKRRGGSLDVKFDGNGKCSFKDCDLYEMWYAGGDGELDFKNCKVGVYKDDTDVLDENHFNYKGLLYVPYSNTNVGNVKIKIEDSEVSFGSSYAFPHTLEATSSVLYNYYNKKRGKNQDVSITNCKLINTIITGVGNCTLRNSELYYDYNIVSSTFVADECTFYQYGTYSLGGDLSLLRADSASITNCKGLNYIRATCTQSASVKNNTFLNTEGETCVNIRAPSSLTFTGNSLAHHGILAISTDGTYDISGNEVESADFETPEGKKKLYSIELGGDATYTFDGDEFAKFTVKEWTSVIASACKIWGGMEINKEALVSVKDDTKITGGINLSPGYLEISDCAIEDCISGYTSTPSGVIDITVDDRSSDFKLLYDENTIKSRGGINIVSGSLNMKPTSTYSGLIINEGSLFASQIPIRSIKGNGRVELQKCELSGFIEGRRVIIKDSHPKSNFAVGVHGFEVVLNGSEITQSVFISEGGILTADSTSIENILSVKGTTKASNCTIGSAYSRNGQSISYWSNTDFNFIDFKDVKIDTTGTGFASFTNCTIHCPLYGDGTTATGCTIYGTVHEGGSLSQFKSCNLTGENAYVNSEFCGTMTECEFNGYFTSERVNHSTGTFDGCRFNGSEGSQLKGFILRPGATVKNMTFYKHSSDHGAIVIYSNGGGDSSRTTTIENCKFLACYSSNSNGAGVGIFMGNAVVKGCTFVENTGTGGAEFRILEPRTCLLEDCYFVNNKYGSNAIDAQINGPKGSSVTVKNCKSAATIFDILFKFRKGGDISFNAVPTPVIENRHAADFL